MADSVGSTGPASPQSTQSTQSAESHDTSQTTSSPAAQTPQDAPTPTQSLAQSPTTADTLAQTPTPGQAATSQETAAERLAAEPTTAERLAQALNAQVQPAFYQEPTTVPGLPGLAGLLGLPGSNVPRNGTHVGMTEAAGAANGFSPNFAGWAADENANVDYNEYDNDAAHAFNFSSQATLARAGTLGARVDAAATSYLNTTDAAGRQVAARELVTAFGQYEHMVQDNRAHGGTDRAQHYADHVDEKPESMAAARRDTNETFAEMHAYLESRGIDPRTVDPGTRPGYHSPYYSGAVDSMGAPSWDHVDRMWNRDAMFNAIRDRFNLATPMGPKPVSQ